MQWLSHMRKIAQTHDLLGIEYAGGPGETLMVFLPRGQERHVLNADDEWLQAHYMKDLFACNFAMAKGRWIFGPSLLCFDETESPFEKVGY